MAPIIEFEDNGQLTPEGTAVAKDIASHSDPKHSEQLEPKRL
jgi:hypothetical protein